jgi:GNAT superfamily N-acetyltransferase
MPFQVKPLTQETWADFEKLFGPKGACAGCWCMWWHLNRAEWTRNKGESNKRLMRAKVRNGEVPGLIGYLHHEPVAWCSVMPRESFAVLNRARMLKVADRVAAWSIPCFFIRKDQRRKGLAAKLLKAAAKYVRSRGGRVLEGYPVIPQRESQPDAFAWTGVLGLFESVGFRECARPSASRAIVRLTWRM